MRINHKGVRQFVATGSTANIPKPLASKQRRILSILDQTAQASELGNPAWRLHSLKGDLAGHSSIRVTGNMRLVFRFDGGGGEAVDVDLVDSH